MGEDWSIIRLQNTMRIVCGALVGLFSLPVIFIGLWFLVYGVRAQSGHGFIVAHDYYGDGAVFLILGLVIFALGIIPAVVRKASALWLGFGFALMLLAAVAIPSFRMPGDFAGSAQSTVMGEMRTVSAAQEKWAENSGLFPADLAELDRVVKEFVENKEERLSPFAQSGERLTYRVTCIADATGSYTHSPEGERPGTIFWAVSHDRKHSWLTATTLDQAVGGKVIFIPAFEQAGPWVLEGSLDRSPEPQEK